MIFVYVYPVELDRNIANVKLIRSYLKKEGIERYTLDEFINGLNGEFIHLDSRWVKIIDDSEGCYPITSLHIDDLKDSGFDVSNVTESDLLTIADRMRDSYLDTLYWESLEEMATDLQIPKKKKSKTKKSKAKKIIKNLTLNENEQ